MLSSNSDPPHYSKQHLIVGLTPPENLYNLGITAWHPAVTFTGSNNKRQLASGERGNIAVDAKWSRDKERIDNTIEELTDEHGRKFPYVRPRDPGDEWHPMYLTFETDDDQIWAAVIYFQVKTHQKGFPEITLDGTTLPSGWAKGRH